MKKIMVLAYIFVFILFCAVMMLLTMAIGYLALELLDGAWRIAVLIVMIIIDSVGVASFGLDFFPKDEA